jgi:hypothetical protein
VSGAVSSRLDSRFAILKVGEGIVNTILRSNGMARLCTGATAAVLVIAGGVALSQPAGASPAASAIVVANAGNSSVTIYAPGANGNVAPIAAISGPHTGLSAPAFATFDGSDNVAVTNTGNNSITIYRPGSQGDAPPLRTITGSNTKLSYPAALGFDASGVLYVLNAGAPYSITEYAPGANGNVAPIATVAGPDTHLTNLQAIGSMVVDRSGLVLVADGSSAEILGFAPGASGNATPIIDIAGSNTTLGGVSGVALDAAGNVWVSGTPNVVTEFAAGSTGNVAPIARILGPATQITFPSNVAVDQASGNIEVTNLGNNSITEYAPGSTGNVAPAAVIAGNLTGLSAPQGLQSGSPILVTDAPDPQTALVGGSASFTASAVGTPSPDQQWQQSTDGGATFTNIAGATGATLDLGPLSQSQDGLLVRALFSSAAGSQPTAAALLTVVGVPTIGITVPADGATYTYGAVPDSSFGCTAGDNATLTSCTASIGGGPSMVSGDPLDASIGEHTLTVTAVDSPLGGATQSVTYTVGPKQVQILPDNVTVTYGYGPDPDFTFATSGLLGDDQLTEQPTCGVSGPHSDAGTYTITCSGGSAGPDYLLTYGTATFTVKRETIVVTPDAQAITYGDPDPAFTFHTTPFVGSDTFTTAPTCGVSDPHSAAGEYTITCTSRDAGPNYTIVDETSTLIVSRKTIVVAADDQTITYGDADPTFTFASTPFVGSDTWVTPPQCGVTGVHTDAGTYTITCTAGDPGPNYTLGAAEDGTLTVERAGLTVTPHAQMTTYGQPDPAFTFVTTGFIGADHFSTPPTCGVSDPHRNVGTYTITCSGGSAGPNYAIDYGTATLTVNPATLTITADDESKLAGQNDPTFSYSVAGLVGTDALVTQPTCDVIGAHDLPGNYPITCHGAAAGDNYTLQYAPGTLSVGLAKPTISTQPSASVPVGGSVSDTATLANAYLPTGTVTFNLYAPGDVSCLHAIYTQQATLAGSSAASGSAPALLPGTYRWTARYGGDGSNEPAESGCGAETVVVTAQVLTGRAYGVTATATLAGLSLLNVAPTPSTGAVSTTGTSTVSPPCAAAIKGLAGVSAVCAKVATTDGYGASSTATATVAAVTISVANLPAVVVRAVESASTTSCAGSTGSVTIAYLKVGTVVLISKPTVIAPNTRIAVGSVSLVLNEQLPFSTPDAGLTVNAVHVHVNVLGLASVNAVIASAESDIRNCP